MRGGGKGKPGDTGDGEECAMGWRGKVGRASEEEANGGGGEER